MPSPNLMADSLRRHYFRGLEKTMSKLSDHKRDMGSSVAGSGDSEPMSTEKGSVALDLDFSSC